MASSADIARALRAADQAGNVEDARRLAKAYTAAREAEQRAAGGHLTPEGLGKSIVTGVRQGVEELAGLPGDVGRMQREAIGWTARKMGADEATANKIQDFTSWPQYLPGSKNVAEGTDLAVKQLPENAAAKVQDITRHQPANATERGFQTFGSFLPALAAPSGEMGWIRRGLQNVVAPTLGTEAGGAIGKPLGYENEGRIIGGLTGAISPGATIRMMSGSVTNPERVRLARYMLDEGISLTPGQVTGSKWRQGLEAGPFGNKGGLMDEQQARELSLAATRRTGYPTDNLRPDTLRDTRQSFGDEYNDLVTRAGGVPLDPPLENDLLNAGSRYEDLKGVDAAPVIRKKFDRIVDAAGRNNGVIPPETYQSIRSDINADLRSNPDSVTTQALRDFQGGMNESIGRSGQPDVANDWRDVDRRYRNLKTLEDAMGGGGEKTGLGYISPAKLRSAAERNDPGGYLVDRGDLSRLGRGGEVFLKDMGQSGTAPRLTSGSLSAMIANVPRAAYSALTTGPMRNFLVNEALSSNPMFNPVTAALLSRQAQNQNNQRGR